MNKTIIHIGLHKTATTFFQEKVWPKVKGFNLLTRPFTQHNHAFNKLQYADETLYRKNELLDEIRNIGSDNIIISDEALSGKVIYFSYLNRTIIAHRLKEIFPDATILLFLRDQKDILLSHYSSYIKNPYGVKKIENVLWKPSKNYTYNDYISSKKLKDLKTLYYNTNDYFIHLDCFLYSYLVKLYTSLFRKVEIFLFEEFLNDKKSMIHRIEEIVGEKINIKSSDLVQKVNRKLHYKELEDKRTLNRYLKFTKNRGIIKVGRQINKISCRKDGKPNFKEYINEFVGDYYTKDNLKLRQMLPRINWGDFKNKYL